MPNSHSGFSAVLLIIVVAVFLSAGLVLTKQNSNIAPISPLVGSLEEDPKSSSFLSELKFFIPKGYLLIEEDEDQFHKRENGDYRKNFTGYVGYKPAVFIKAVVIKENGDTREVYEKAPFTVWAFENPNDLSIEDWYDKYWYYPFVWGMFRSTDKKKVEPQMISTISGQIFKSTIVDYKPNSPKFTYLAKAQKMYLFRIVGDKGEKILEKIEFIK